MDMDCSQSGSGVKRISPVPRRVLILRLIAKLGRRLYDFLAPRAYSAIIFAALFCTLLVKFFHSWRNNVISEYPGWIPNDISALLGAEISLAILCSRWPRRWIVRTAIVVAAIVCTWSVLNAGFLIRTGTQLLPTVLLSLFRDPPNILRMIGVNMLKRPIAAAALVVPSAIALTFFFFVLAKPPMPNYNHKRFVGKISMSLAIIFIAVLTRGAAARRGSAQIAFESLRYNCQLKAVTTLFSSAYERVVENDSAKHTRKLPAFNRLKIEMSPKRQPTNRNIVIVVLEGVQYNYTSLADARKSPAFAAERKMASPGALTAHLAALANEGVEFVNARSSLTHTTKALFSLLTGRYPSVSQDIAEAVPAIKPYASIATVLKQKLNFRTAFFQSAKGNFESRPALVYNLGFDKFWAREDLWDPNAFVGYLGCDEFSMLKPITEWIKADDRPFLLTIMCSVTHDPYEIPKWFASEIPSRLAAARQPVQRYWQTIFYTDKFIAALDAELARLNLTDKTILCIIGDHGEAFGEHGLLGHERIPFGEALHIPFVLRAPFLIKPASKVTKPVGSIDLTPTLLALLGLDTSSAGFDGIDALGDIPDGRKLFFAGWMQQSPAGFVKGNHKFIYDPASKKTFVYDLSTDPDELLGTELPGQREQEVGNEITTWQKNSIFQIDQNRTGRKLVFGQWLCRWGDRVSLAKYCP